MRWKSPTIIICALMILLGLTLTEASYKYNPFIDDFDYYETSNGSSSNVSVDYSLVVLRNGTNNLTAPWNAGYNITAPGFLGTYGILQYLVSDTVQFNTSFSDGSNEGRLQWNTDDGTLEFGLPGGQVNLQVGQEMLVRVKNEESFDILNGKVVYASSASGAVKYVKVASASNYTQASRVVGVATENISAGQFGYITTSGLVRDMNTSAFADAAVAYLGENGSLSTTIPVSPNASVVVGLIAYSHVNNGVLYVKITQYPRLNELSDVYSSATNLAVLQYNSTSQRWENSFKLDTSDQRYNNTLMIVSVNDSLWLAKLNITDQRYNETLIIRSVNDSFYTQDTAVRDPTGFRDTTTSTISFNQTTRNLTFVGTYPVYIDGRVYNRTNDSVIIPNVSGQMNYVYYDDSTGMKQSSTPWQFESIAQAATVYWDVNKGMVADERHGIAMDWRTHEYLHETIGTRYAHGLAGTFNDTSFTIGIGEYYDEDVEYEVASVLSNCDVTYHANGSVFTWQANQTQYFFKNATNMYYDNGTGLQAVGVSKFMAVYVMATNNIDTPIMCILGQRTDGTIANARANNVYESLTLGTLPVPEMKLLYRVILKNDVTPYEETTDYRSTQAAGSTYVATDHGTLTGLNDDDHTQYLLVDGSRNMTGNLSFTTGGINASYIQNAPWISSVPYQSSAAGWTNNSQNITTSLNVGIGVNAPGQRLVVNGSINITGSGAALYFPDGTNMTTASSGSGSGNISGGGTVNTVAIFDGSNTIKSGKINVNEFGDFHTGRYGDYYGLSFSNRSNTLCINNYLSPCNSSSSYALSLYVNGAAETGTLTVKGAMSVTGNMYGAEDFWTTGTGDDLWLGNVTQSSALFRAYAAGYLFVNKTINTSTLCLNGTCQSVWSSGTGNLSGSGEAGYLPQFQNSSYLNNSIIFQNGSSIGVGTTSPYGIFSVASPAFSSIIFALSDNTMNTPLFVINQGGSGNANALFYGINGQNPVGFTSATPTYFLNGLVLGSRGAGLAPSFQGLKTSATIGTGTETVMPITFGSEIISDGNFSTGNSSWNVTSTGDCSFVSGGIYCSYNTGATTRIIQGSSSLLSDIKALQFYRMNFTIKNATAASSGAGYASLNIYAPSNTQVSLTEAYNRTSAVFDFKTRPTNGTSFELRVALLPGQSFFLTNLSLKEITSGGIYTGGGVEGIYIAQNGNVWIGPGSNLTTTNPITSLDVNGTIHISQHTIPPCNSTYAGSVDYNWTTNKHIGCNSTNWNNLY